ncbi:alcohol dehydrogenase catalytic domain-containing protein [bacterium]|nr:alcohol dehydrogenase catalytic domain-containing protein [bacterium]
MTTIRAWAATAPGKALEPYHYDMGEIGPDEVEVAVESCGICHSDLSMVENEWGMAQYPLVPGHEVIGRVVALGKHAKGLKVGQRVGIGWNVSSCTHCRSCVGGEQHLCNEVQATIVAHHGGFAERLRAHWTWALPIPDSLDAKKAGPLLCGGITVFAPLLLHDIRPTQRVGVIGIGGLGHMALKFLNAWGCEVTAFTSSDSKRDEAKRLGAHRVLSSRDSNGMAAAKGSLDLIIDTVNVPLDWEAVMGTLAPKGALHVVGAVLDPVQVSAFTLIGGQKSISGSPTGSPSNMATMLEFAARHQIAPDTEHFPMSRVNEAFEHLKSGKARYRIVLDADF